MTFDMNISSFHDSHGHDCSYPLRVLDFRPPLDCSNNTKCEQDWPCELRHYWVDLHLFVDFTRGILLYGTSIIIILGVFLNTVSFYTLKSSGLAKQGSGIYLLVLAVCDSGNLLFNYAVGVGRAQFLELNRLFMVNEWLCRFHGVFVEVFQLYSAWIVVGFTVERCFIVWYPLTARQTRSSRSKIVVLSLGVVFTLFSLSKLFLTGFETDSIFGYKGCRSNRYKWAGMAYVGIALQTWIPTCIVFTFNCLMFFKLKRIKTNRDKLTGNSRATQKRAVQQSFLYRPSATTPMLIAVSLAYLILVFPLGVVQTIELYWKQVEVKSSVWDHHQQKYIKWKMTAVLLKYVRAFCFGLYQTNFAINFFLYFAAGVQFRVHLLNKLGAWKKIFGNACCNSSKDSNNFNNTHNSSAKAMISQVTTSTVV